MWLALGKYLVAPILAGLAAAVATNYFAARFSFARFRKEQWWTEKRNAYHSIIQELSRIAFNASAEMSRVASSGDISPAQIPRADKSGSWSLQEIVSAGAYIISAKSVKAVEKALNSFASSQYINSEDPGEAAGSNYRAAQEALAIVRAEAHRELGVL